MSINLENALRISKDGTEIKQIDIDSDIAWQRAIAREASMKQSFTPTRSGSPLSFTIGGKTKQGVLPEGYTQLEYIQSSGTQWIDTGVKATHEAFKVVIDASLRGSQGMLGSQTSSQNSSTHLIFSNKLYIGNDGPISSNIFSSTTRGIVILESTEDKCYSITKYDGTIETGTYTGTIINNKSYYLYGMNAATTNVSATGNIYNVKFYDDGVLVGNFIPAKNSSNVLGMYDLVSNQFFTNAGTGTFTAGPVAPTPTCPVEIKGVGDYYLRPNQQFNIARKSTASSIWGCSMTPDLATGLIHLTGTGTTTDFANSSGLSEWYPNGSMIAGHIYYVDMRGLEIGSQSPISIRFDGSYRTAWTEPIIFTRGSAGNSVFSWNITKNRVYDNWFTPQIIDLTLMYGAGNEPTTIADFKARLGVDDIPLYSYSATNVEQYKVPILQATNCGCVDLGTLTYAYGATFAFDYTTIGYKKGSDNAVCEGYRFVGQITQVAQLNNMEIGYNPTTSKMYFKNTAYTDAAAFKAAMSGVMLYYQRTTDASWVAPTTTSIYLSAPLQQINTYTDTLNSAGSLTRNIGVKVFDGTETWYYESEYSRFISPMLPGCLVGVIRTVSGYCSHYKVINDGRPIGDVSIGDCYYVKNAQVSSTTPSALIHDSHTSVESFKSWLAAQYAAGTPVVVYYPLATPTTEQVTFPTFSLAKGSTNIFDIATQVAPDTTTKVGYYAID